MLPGLGEGRDSGLPGSAWLLASQRCQARPDESDREKHRTAGTAGLSRPAGTVPGSQAVTGALPQKGVLRRWPGSQRKSEKSARDHGSTLPAAGRPVKLTLPGGPDDTPRRGVSSSILPQLGATMGKLVFGGLLRGDGPGSGDGGSAAGAGLYLLDIAALRTNLKER